MQNRKFGALSSSVNPDQLSATVSGGILAFSGLIILAGHYLGISLADGQVAQFAQQAGISVGFLWALFGVIRKIVVSIQQKLSVQ